MNRTRLARYAAPITLIMGGALALLSPVWATSPAKPPAAASSVNQCDRVATSGWYAWVDKMPGPGFKGPRLHVTARANTTDAGNSANWTYRLNLGPMQESMPPSQIIEFVATRGKANPPAQPDPAQIKGRFDGAQSRYREIVITCKGRVIARVEPEVVY